jgi:hypothetical protein
MESRNRRAKPKLADLSRGTPSLEEHNVLRTAFKEAVGTKEGTHLTTAILGAAFPEIELENAIRRRLQRNDDDTWNSLTDEGGPLGTFSSKILIGYALKLYGEDMRKNLNIIRKIRNVFAHTKRHVDFDNDLILAELRKVAIPIGRKTHYVQELTLVQSMVNGGQESYGKLCVIVALELAKLRFRALKASVRRLKKREKKVLWNNRFRSGT